MHRFALVTLLASCCTQLASGTYQGMCVVINCELCVVLCFVQVSHVVVSTLDALWLAPKGLKDVHNMLRNVARSLVAGGQTNVFSPMHMLVFQKPADA